MRADRLAWCPLALIVACVPSDPTSDLAQGIFLGEPDTQPSHMAVVAITYGPGEGYYCSGTLISSHVVLTAGHCLIGELAGDIQVFFGHDAFLEDGEYRQAAELLVHRDYDDYALTADIALIRLASPAPQSVFPIPHLPQSLGLSANDVGATVDWSGFGLTETDAEGEKRHVQGTIIEVCPGPDYCEGGLVVPGAFYYSMEDGGPCSGDSGGPTFLQRSGREMTVGVTSYGDELCTDYGVNTTVSAYASWIEEFMAAGGTESCDNLVDDDADGAIDCEDAKCKGQVGCPGDNGGDGGFCAAGGSPRGMAAYVLAIVALGASRRRRRH